ncbi:MAG: Uncharacterised protein [Methanobacteriota archaeon]|nr:MAG: Uncharacterised protein [Euryarchaeota archaeon]
MAPAAKPDVLHLPYLNRNPPGEEGSPNTGLPAIISFIYFQTCFILRDLNFGLQSYISPARVSTSFSLSRENPQAFLFGFQIP